MGRLEVALTALGMTLDDSVPHQKKVPLGTPPHADGSQVPRLRTKIDPLEFAYRCIRMHTDPAGDGETVHELHFRPPVPHAPGVRMT